MRNTFIIFILIGVCSSNVHSQTHEIKRLNCDTYNSRNSFNSLHPNAETDQQFEYWIAKAIKDRRQSRTVEYTQYLIPVIFHIIHNGEEQGDGSNISAIQIEAQLSQLNADFANLSGSQYGQAADIEIQFCLALRSPNGLILAEPGIERINRNTMGWTSPPYNGEGWNSYVDQTIMPNSYWNPYEYFNIWTLALSGTLGGKSTFPTSSTLPGIESDETDTHCGVFIKFESVGSIEDPGPLGPDYGIGRVLTHEAGHYFGLKHIWGDAYCGTDYCGDTPIQDAPTEDCPDPGALNNCEPSLPKMFENYMDYTAHSCMNTLTEDQKERMQTVMANSPRRIELDYSIACCIEPELTIINPAVVPLNVTAGNSVSATFAEDNNGSTVAPPNYVKFYLSSNDILTPGQNGDIYLGQYFINQSIAPLSQTILLSKTLTIPGTVATGTYYLFYWADGSQIVEECLEDNNFATAILNVTGVPQLADLIVQNASVSPTSIEPGESGTVYCKNKNQGVLPAVSSYTAVWLSQDQNYDGAPTDINLNADIAIPALEPGQTSALFSEQITIPTGTACGTWYIMFGADALGDVPEGANENNNHDFIPITISCPLMCSNDYSCGPPAPPVLSISTTCNHTSCSTVNATPPSQDIPYVSCAGNPYQAARYDDDVWFRITPTNTNPLVITVVPTSNLENFDPVIGLYVGDCLTPAQVGCADLYPSGGTENLYYTPNAGTTYLIRVFGYGIGSAYSGNFDICVAEGAPAAGLYWIANSGNWSDGSHWSTTSGGAPCNCVPTLDDNVYFDVNSFSGGGQSVNVNAAGYCKSMNWTGAVSSSTLSGSSALNIYGSLTFNASMNVTYTGQITFKSNNPGNTIQTFGKSLSSQIYFDALGGEWTLQDDLNAPNQDIYLNTGSLNSNNKTITSSRFKSTGNGIRILTLGASVLNLSGSYSCCSDTYAWQISGSNFTLSSGTSTINLSGSYSYFYSVNSSLSYYDVTLSGASQQSLVASSSSSFHDVTFSGNAPQSISSGNSTVFHDVTFGGSASLSGAATYHDVTLMNNGSFSSSSSFNNLTLAPGKSYTFGAGNTFIFSGSLSADGTCATPTQIFSNNSGSAAILSKASGAVTINYSLLRDIIATGGAVFTANECTDFGNNNGWVINNPSSQNLFWIGNGGNWSDPNHWSLTSGGTSSGCIPTPYNNIFFDANSFSGGGQSVTINQTAFCKSMNWTGAVSSSTLSGSSALNIYGSLTLNPSINVTYVGQITFKSNNPGNTIQTFAKSLSSQIYFDALGGEWTLQDDLNAPNQDIYLNTGSLNSNNKTITSSRFKSTGNGIRILTLGASVLNLSGSYSCCSDTYAWQISGSNFTLSSGTSTINLSGSYSYFYSVNSSLSYYDVTLSGASQQSLVASSSSSFHDVTFSGNAPQSLSGGNSTVFHDVTFGGSASLSGAATYHDVTLMNNGSFSSSSSFNNLTLAPGKSYTFGAGNTFIFSGSLSADGTCATPTQIFSNNSGSAAILSKASGAVTINYSLLRDITATGGAVFTANNSTDLGNNNGWTFGPFSSQNYYWVGNGGNWSDGYHWALTSGGDGSGCVPTLYDNIFFDSNSFTNGGQTVTINQTAFCKSMNWTGAVSSSTLSGSSALNIYGSLTFNASMNVTYTGQITFKSNNPGNTIQTFGKSLSSQIYFDALGGEWTLQDDLNAPNQDIYLNTGSLNSNNKTITSSRFKSTGNGIRILTLGASVLNLSGSYSCCSDTYAWQISGSNFTLSSGTSTINLSGSYSYFYSVNSSLSYYDVTLSGASQQSLVASSSSSFHDVTFSGNAPQSISSGNSTVFHDVTFGGSASLSGAATYHDVTLMNNGSFSSSSSFNNLTLAPGKSYTFGAGNTFIFSGSLSADGTCATPTQIFSNNSGSAAILSKASGAVTINYSLLRDIIATGGAVFTANECTDFGNNNGWVINNPSSQNLFWIGNGGNWSDPNHWSLTSGGTSSGCIPTPYNNIFFDANSFSGGGQSVTINQTAFCKSMNWTGAVSSSTLSGSSALNIYGSLTLNPSINVTYVGQITFKSNNPGNTIQTFAKSLSSQIYFDALGGEWTLQDDLNAPNQDIYLNTGSLNSNNKTITSSRFKSTGNGIRILTLGASVLNLSGSYSCCSDTYAWQISGSNFTLSSGTSTINLSGSYSYFYSVNSSLSYYDVTLSGASQQSLVASSSSSFHDVTFSGNAPQSLSGGNSTVFHDVTFGGSASLSGAATYHDVTLMNNGSFSSSSSFNNLTLAPGKSYSFANGSTYTFNGNLFATGSGGNLISITCSSGFATFSKISGSMCLDYITMQNIHATGGAYFFAGANSNNITGNVGWSFASCSQNIPPTPGNPTSNSPQCNIVTLTAPPSPPSGVVWYWQGISCGTATNLGSGPTFSATSSGTYYLRAYDPGCSCWSTGCGSVSVEVFQTTDRTWLGTISTDWMNANNWSCGSAPNPDNDVIIPAATPFSPILHNGSSVWCKSLHLLPGAIVTVEPNAHLNLIQY